MSIIKLFAIFLFNIIDKFIHQRKILRELKKVIFKVDLFIDVGAHKGSYTDLILKNFQTKNIYMFEPQKKIYNFSKKKYRKFKNIKIFNTAVSNTNKSKNIYINKHDLTSSLNKLNKKNIYLNFKAKIFGSNISNMIHEMYHVKTEKLSTIIKKNKFKKIDLLKIDTEGHEFEVLKGLENKIKIVKNINLYKQLATSEFQAGVFSTALYEGVEFNCKTILLDLPGIEYMDKFIEEYNPILI